MLLQYPFFLKNCPIKIQVISWITFVWVLIFIILQFQLLKRTPPILSVTNSSFLWNLLSCFPLCVPLSWQKMRLSWWLAWTVWRCCPCTAHAVTEGSVLSPHAGHHVRNALPSPLALLSSTAGKWRMLQCYLTCWHSTLLILRHQPLPHSTRKLFQEKNQTFPVKYLQ